jgi:capsular polysaccharide biosynthesis protein
MLETTYKKMTVVEKLNYLGGANLSIGIGEIGKIIRRRWILICSIVLGMVSLAGGLSFYVIKPVYQASATLLVQSNPTGNQIAYNDLIANQNLVKTYADIFKSRKITEDVIQRVQLEISNEELLKKVKFHDSFDSLVTECQLPTILLKGQLRLRMRLFTRSKII